MGGKTQQRVAGNVKPSSSGRIRELLINTHGVGNIITFSTLSSGPQQNPSVQPKEPKEPIKPAENPAPPKSPQSSSSGSSGVNRVANSSDKTTLVVRRVGNRDYFTRIRAPKESADQDQSDQSSSKTVYYEGQSSEQTKQLTNTDPDTESCENQNEYQVKHDTNKSNDSNADDESPESVEQNEVYNFDELLDELAEIQISSNQGNVDSLSKMSSEAIAKERELIRVLKVLIREFKEDLSIQEWDLVNGSINKWIAMILKSNLSSDKIDFIFCVDVFNFMHQLILLAQALRKVEDLGEKSPMLQSLLDDWDNFSLSKAYHDLIILYFKLVQISNGKEEMSPVIEALANIVIHVDPKSVISDINLLGHLSAKIEFDPEFELPKNIKYCEINEANFKGFRAITGLLKNNDRVILVTTHAILRKIMSTISESFEASSVISDKDDIDNLLLAPTAALTSILTSRDSMMSALLSDYRSGDISVTMEPNTDSYACTLSYLFVWDLVIQFIFNIDKEVGHRIIHCLKKLGLIQRLLDNVFMLLPPLGERDSLKLRIESNDNNKDHVELNDQKSWSLSEFLKSPLSTTVIRPVNEIELTALHIYFSVAWHMPVTVRKWFNNNSNKRLCNLVSEYTVKHVSQVICSLEMETVQEKCQERANEDKMRNLVIKARPTAKEVYAVYTRDEFRMELTIKLPLNYPLGSVQVDGGKRVGVTDLKWRSWLLQLTTFLSHQNGPILDGIDLWRRNIDKRFEGIEKCMICFSILHSNYQLPKKKCQTCSKMFHNLCLYKWFETSGNSTCPLCRNTW